MLSMLKGTFYNYKERVFSSHSTACCCLGKRSTISLPPVTDLPAQWLLEHFSWKSLELPLPKGTHQE